MSHGPVSETVWEEIRTEFGLPTQEQVRQRLGTLVEDPAPIMRQASRVFIGEGTYCPGYQFLDTGRLHPVVVELFAAAMDLTIAHNYFAAWMITPTRALNGSRPVDVLDGPTPPLFKALEAFGP